MARLHGIRSVITPCKHCGYQGDGANANFRIEKRIAYREQGEKGSEYWSAVPCLQQEVLVCLSPECGKVHEVIGEVK